jgi:competence protein ComGC
LFQTLNRNLIKKKNRYIIVRLLGSLMVIYILLTKKEYDLIRLNSHATERGVVAVTKCYNSKLCEL